MYVLCFALCFVMGGLGIGNRCVNLRDRCEAARLVTVVRENPEVNLRGLRLKAAIESLKLEFESKWFRSSRKSLKVGVKKRIQSKENQILYINKYFQP